MDERLTIKIDPATGLPELPEGRFWHVKMAYGHPHVTIRKNITMFGMKLWSIQVAEEIMVRLTKEQVLQDAILLHRKTYSKPFNGSLLGSYPPKKLAE